MKPEKGKKGKKKSKTAKTVAGSVQQTLQKKDIQHSVDVYRTLFEISGDGILIADIGTKQFKYANPAICRILGYTEDEMVNLSVPDIHPKESIEHVISEFEAQASGEKPLAENIPCLRKDGEVIYADFNTVPAIIDGAKCNIGIVRDVTERKRTEEELHKHREHLEDLVEERAEELKKELSERKQVEEKLKKSEERLKVIIDHVADVLWRIDLNGKVTFVTPSVEKLTGYSIDEFLSLPAAHFIEEESKKLADSVILGLIKKNDYTPKSIQQQCICKDGTKKWTEVTLSLEPDASGKPKAVIGVTRDITERKQVEKSLRESEEKFRSILKSMDDLVFVLDKHNRYVSYYAPENKLYVKPDVFLGKKHSEVMPAFIDELFTNALMEVKQNKIAEYEYQLEVPDGLHWYNMKLSPIMEGDEYAGLVAVARDITERKKTEEALIKSEQKCRNVFESVNDGIFTMDLNGTYTEVNKRVLEMYGLNSTDEIIGKNGFEFVAPQDIEKAKEGMKKVLEGGSVVRQEFNTLRVDGREITIEVTGSLLKDESGNPIGITGIARDITERRRVVEELRKTERLESLGFLAGGIAHDFNNLLSGIFGQIELAIANRTSEQKVLQSLERALQAMNRARDLTHQLLTFSSGGAPIKKLISIGDDLRESVTFALSGSNIHPVFSIDENLLPVDADQSQINQVINNILLNARQAMPEGGTIEIEAENFDLKTEKSLPLKQGMYVQIAVKDHGIGMPGDILEKIFDPFYTTKQTGSGLGLSICYSIIKKHDGHITVDSTPGAGSVFTIYLPASEEEFQREPEKQYELLEGKGKILVMDDEPIVCELLAGELDLLGYEVIVTQNGDEAVQAYKKELESGAKFDAVILDLTIPGGKGGKEIIKELQKISPDIKAVVSSGYSENPVIADPVKYGFRNAIQKPFKMEVLSQVLYDLLYE
ncbi:PAS domain S-box protein [Fibrobacterota bacterium]